MNITDGTSVFEVNYKKATFKGMIMPFSGSFDTDGYPIDGSTNIVRKDWHICDGTNGTPDLRGRFILGASDSHAVGSTGGEENHTLTVEELPKFTPAFDGGGNALVYNNTKYNDTEEGFQGGSLWHDERKTCNASFSSIGNNQPHNNMPPYYTLSYIMKI